MQEANAEKEGIPQKVLLGLGVVAAVVVIGLIVYFYRAGDPAARGPIPYKKIDYGAYKAQQERELIRRSPSNPAPTR